MNAIGMRKVWCSIMSPYKPVRACFVLKVLSVYYSAYQKSLDYIRLHILMNIFFNL